MRHELVIEGPAFRLRPVGDDDAAFILGLRNDPELGRFLHPTQGGLAGQQAWLDSYYAQPGDYYFVVERRNNGAAEGVVSIYDIKAERGEWGRWILQAKSPAAIESAWLTYRCAFETLGLESVYCRTVATNRSVVSFHDSCGIGKRRILERHFDLGGEKVDAVEHEVSHLDWPTLNARLGVLATLTARRLQRD